MIKEYLQCIRIEAVRHANMLGNIIADLPFYKEKENESREKASLFVTGELLFFLWKIIKIYAYVMVFMYIPKLVFSKITTVGTSGFSTEDCFVFFTLVLTCVVGSIIHSGIFDVNKDSYCTIKILRVRPVIYFRVKFIYRLITELLGFWSAFTILGMNYVKAFYLVIIICLSRSVGECINILIFKMTGKRFADHKGAFLLLMLAGLFVAYFVPYVRGCVPAAYIRIFDSIWVAAILGTGSVFTYYVWSYRNYEKIISRVYTEEQFDETEDGEKDWISYNSNEGMKSYTGDKRLFHLYFKRTSGKAIYNNMIKVIIIAIFFVLGVLAIEMGNKDAVGTVISYSLPLLALVMYCLCNCSGYCRDLFTNCDIHILRKDNTGEGLAGNFIFCLYNILKINAVPIITLAASYFILGCICQVYVITAQIIICIVFMGLFFSIFGLFTYYMFQPYNADGTVRSFRYYMPSLLMYALCYGCIFVKADSIIFVVVSGILTSVMVIMSLNLVYRISDRTFVLNK